MHVFKIINPSAPYAGKELWSFHGEDDYENEVVHGYVKIGRDKFARGVREYGKYEVEFSHKNDANLRIARTDS